MACLITQAVLDSLFLKVNTIDSKLNTLQSSVNTLDGKVVTIDGKMDTLTAKVNITLQNQRVEAGLQLLWEYQYLKQKIAEYLFNTYIAENVYEEGNPHPGTSQKWHKNHLYYNSYYGGAVSGYILKIHCERKVGIDQNGAMSMLEAENFHTITLENMTNECWWGEYEIQDAWTLTDTQIGYKVESWIMAPAKSELTWLRHLLNFVEPDTCDKLEMKLYPTWTAMFGADLSKIWGWKSVGASFNDNWSTEWFRTIFPQWHSNMGGPK